MAGDEGALNDCNTYSTVFLYAYLVAVSESEQSAHTAGTVSKMGVSTQSTQ